MIPLYRRRWTILYLPVLTLAAAVVWLLAHSVLALPPRALAIAVGVPQGGYAQTGERYREELERRGIATQLLATASGALGPLQRLANAGDVAQAGFGHGLLAEHGPEADVQALASIGRQPVWVFVPQQQATQLGELRGSRIAAGPQGGAIRIVAEALLAQHRVPPEAVTWVPLQGLAAANALLAREVDAMITIGSSDAPTVRLLSRSPGVAIVGVDSASALAVREPRLQPFVLPQGAIELSGNVPPRDLTLLSTATHLLVRPGMHPALQRALLDVATEVHGTPTFLQQQAEFPEFQTDFPLSPVARAYALGDRPWMEHMLPYWWAQVAQLLLYGLLPVAVCTLLLLLWIPRLFRLRVDAELAQYYGELKFLEHEIDQVTDNPIQLRALLQRLDQLELAAAALDLPSRYADRWYTLREHLADARERLLKVRGR